MSENTDVINEREERLLTHISYIRRELRDIAQKIASSGTMSHQNRNIIAMVSISRLLLLASSDYDGTDIDAIPF